MTPKLQLLVYILAVLLYSCTENAKHTGVTSTGNPGEVAGIVVSQRPNHLAKPSLIAQQAKDSLYPLRNALIIMSKGNQKIDSTYSDALGYFHLDSIASGDYRLVAYFQNDSAVLENLEVDSIHLNVQLTLYGSSQLLETSWTPSSTFSDQSDVAKILVPLRWSYEEQTQILTIYRLKASLGQCAQATYDTAQWSVEWNALTMKLKEPGCDAFPFFSTAPEVLAGNSWFLNENLQTYASVQNPSPGCSGHLPLLKEMKKWNMQALRLDFKENGVLNAVLEGDLWCMNDILQPSSEWSLLLGGLSLTTQNCHLYHTTIQEDEWQIDAMQLRTDVGLWMLKFSNADTTCYWDQCSETKPGCLPQ